MSAISSDSITTASVLLNGFYAAGYGVTYNITVTNMFVAPDGAWCAHFDQQKRCSPTILLPTPTTTHVQTRYWAPLIISNPASCTETSFSYTSSQRQFPNEFSRGMLGPSHIGSVMSAQATEPAQMLFITTYVVTIATDTNMGGQVVTQSVVDVYLKSDAVQGVIPMSEAFYLSQCVDPSSVLCQTSAPASFDLGCGPTNAMTYPPRGAAVAGGASPTGSASTAATTSKKSGVGRKSKTHLVLSLGVVVLTTVLLVW